jgi:hypothetical protein
MHLFCVINVVAKYHRKCNVSAECVTMTSANENVSIVRNTAEPTSYRGDGWSRSVCLTQDFAPL